MEHNLVFFGYGSSCNTNSQCYINKIERIWNELYEKSQKELEKNIKNEIMRCKNKPQQLDTEKIKSECNKKFELELDHKIQKEFQKILDKCYIDGIVLYMLCNGYKIDPFIIENALKSIEKEYNFLQKNNFSVIMDKHIFWNDKKNRINCLNAEIKFLENISKNNGAQNTTNNFCQKL